MTSKGSAKSVRFKRERARERLQDKYGQFWPMAKLPCVECHHPRGMNDLGICPICLGSGVVLALPWGAAPPSRTVKRLNYEQVLALRFVGCKLSDYPVEGTKEWRAFQQEYEEAKSKKNAALDALPKPSKLRRGRGKKVIITQTPLDAPGKKRSLLTKAVSSNTRKDH